MADTFLAPSGSALTTPQDFREFVEGFGGGPKKGRKKSTFLGDLTKDIVTRNLLKSREGWSVVKDEQGVLFWIKGDVRERMTASERKFVQGFANRQAAR